MNIRRDIRFRVYIAFTFMCLFGIAIIVKAVMIHVKEGPYLRRLSHEMHTRFDTLIAERGNILNEDGVLLSSSVPEFDVHIDFSVIDSATFAKNLDSLSLCMAKLMGRKGRSVAGYRAAFIRAYDSRSKYYLLARKLKYYEYETMRGFPIFRKGQARGGFIAEPREKRILPYDVLAKRTLGIFRDNNITGLEAKYNNDLAGENGRRVVQKATGSVWVPVEGSEVDPVHGKDIVTTLDMDVQNVAYHALLSNMQKYECRSGTCIVMEVATGKIRTLVNLGRQKDGSYAEDFNYATIPTEPGSTFKLATMAVLLNDKKTTIDRSVDIQGGKKQFANRTMYDSHPDGKTMEIPIWKAFAHSSNVAMATLAEKYYHDKPQQFIDNLRKLHIDKPTGIDLLGERLPVLTDPKGRIWSATTLPWMATGYGVMITPLRTCMLYNAVANGGKMMRPYLVSAIREYGKDVRQIEPKVETVIGDEATVKQLRRCTRAVVTDGTAKGIESPFYTMCGKTGTAQVADKGIRYSDGVYQGSFVGYLPADDPKYTVCVVIRTKPHSSAYYGGTIAAPVFRMVADKIFSQNMGAWSAPIDSMARTGKAAMPAAAATAETYERVLDGIHKKLALNTDNKAAMMQIVTDTFHHTRVQPKHVYRGIMPDVVGMTVKDAVFMLENSGVHVVVKGMGRVAEQSVPAGTALSKGQKVTLQLS